MGFGELQVVVEADDRVVCRSDGGAEAVGRFQLSRLHEQLIRLFHDWLRTDRLTKPAELRALGALLFESLFDSNTEAFFRRRLADVAKGDRLRLQLVFRKEALDLAATPWEFLYSPDAEGRQGFFLATRPELVLSRYLPMEVDREELRPAERPLRLLAVVSQPEDLPPVLAAPVVAQLEGLGTAGLPIQFRLLEQPTVESLLDVVETYRPHLLHYFGHGRFAGRGQLALLREGGGGSEWVDDTRLVGLFDRCQPRLVVLQACEGATVDLEDGFAGVAPQMVRAGIPAVVAMQYPITNQTAIDFSRSFYRGVTEGAPVDAAVQEGRRRIQLVAGHTGRLRDFGTPVLYMRSRDGVILP